MRHLTYISFVWFLLSVAQAVAAPVELRTVQILEPSRSAARIVLNSPLGKLGARLKHYSGKLFVDKKDFAKSSVELQVNLSDVALEDSDNFAFSPFSGLLKTLPEPNAQFTSTAIQRLGNEKYRVTGHWTRAQKKHPVTIIAEVLESSPQSTTVRFNLAGDLDSSRQQVFPSLPTFDHAEFTSRLVFIAAMNK